MSFDMGVFQLVIMELLIDIQGLAEGARYVIQRGRVTVVRFVTPPSHDLTTTQTQKNKMEFRKTNHHQSVLINLALRRSQMPADAVDENKAILCCALCCVNCAVYPACDCFGASGKLGVCCCNLECCCKPGAPCLVPFCCLGARIECDGCSALNAQCQACCLLVSAAFPCNAEVPATLTIAGLTLYPKVGCCMKQGVVAGKIYR